MARLIDADAWIESHCEGCGYRENYGCSKDDPVCEAVERVNKAPTVDAVKVVRCKDCTRREICRTTNVWAFSPGDDWYCADGEKRGDYQ